jgi:zinc and cadmium transporter
LVEATFGWIMLAAFLACAVTTIGIWVINRFASWGKRNMVYFMAFAAGVLVSVSFMHIIPKAFSMNDYAPLFLLAGFLSLYLLNRFMKLFICSEKECDDYTFGVIPALGIGFHSFIDGIIYSVTFSVSIFTGALAAIGMVLHEFPEGIVTFLLLIKSGFKKKKAAWYSFLAAAITTPLGALVSWPFINNLTEPVLGVLLSLSAGALVYVGATHLLPHVEHENKKYTFAALAAGILVAVVIMMAG